MSESSLDFEAVQRELSEQYAHCPPVLEPHRPLLQAQHRALLAAAVQQARQEEREKVAPLVAAVREWQEARKAWWDSSSPSDARRLNDAEAALAALPLPPEVP